MKTVQEQLDELRQTQLADLQGALALAEALYRQLGGTVTEDVTRQIKQLITAILSAASADTTARFMHMRMGAEDRARRAAPPPTDS